MTLLERYDNEDWLNIKSTEIRRALAIAQAVEETDPPLMYSSKMQEAYHLQFLDQIKRRADELLEGK